LFLILPKFLVKKNAGSECVVLHLSGQDIYFPQDVATEKKK